MNHCGRHGAYHQDAKACPTCCAEYGLNDNGHCGNCDCIECGGSRFSGKEVLM